MKFHNKTVDKFMWWMTERHDIYLRREAGKPWPWTDDKIMQTYKFTNVYRQLDRVTVELNKRMKAVRDFDKADRLFHVCLFRAFNWPQTYDRLVVEGALSRTDFDARRAKSALKQMAKTAKVFTGAYIITNAGSKRSKIDLMCEAMAKLYKDRRAVWAAIEHHGTMQGAVDILTAYPSFGNFTAYEVACDLRYQKGMLDKARDALTWANLGPGAKRGIQRLCHGGANVKLQKSDYDEEWFVDRMRGLLDIANLKLPARMPTLEMREIEHSLCEFDKYLRVQRGEGRPRSKYEAPKEAYP